MRGAGFWGVLLDASHSAITNNSFSLEGRGDRAINLQTFGASFNVVANNIISRPSLLRSFSKGAPETAPRPTSSSSTSRMSAP